MISSHIYKKIGRWNSFRIKALVCRSVFRATSRLDDKSPVTLLYCQNDSLHSIPASNSNLLFPSLGLILYLALSRLQLLRPFLLSSFLEGLECCLNWNAIMINGASVYLDARMSLLTSHKRGVNNSQHWLNRFSHSSFLFHLTFPFTPTYYPKDILLSPVS